MRILLFTSILFVSTFSSFSFEPFVGVNIISPFAELDDQLSGKILPLLSNMESGLSIIAGININRYNSLESKLVLGSATDLYDVYQFHFGYNFYILKYLGSNLTGTYTGIFLKHISLNNNMTDISYNSLIPYITLGYRFDIKNYFIDLRINQTIYAISYSNREDTKTGHGFHFSIWKNVAPVIPYFNISAGFNL